MNNSYEIIGNQIKYYLRDDPTRGWTTYLVRNFEV